jgi:hypothetical protein
MSDELNDVVDNVKQGSTWFRILLMVGFYVVLYVVGVVVVFVTLAQALFSIFTGSDNTNLRQLGASLSDYVSQILLYVTYNSDTRPFPFSPFPGADGNPNAPDDNEATIDSSASAKASTKKKSTSTTRKKTASKKKTSASSAKSPAKTSTGETSASPDSKADQ